MTLLVVLMSPMDLRWLPVEFLSLSFWFLLVSYGFLLAGILCIPYGFLRASDGFPEVAPKDSLRSFSCFLK